MKKTLLFLLMLLPVSLLAQEVTYTIGAASTTPTVWSSVTPGTYYKFQHGGAVSTHHMSSDGTNMKGVETSTNALDEAAVWTLETATGGYKIKNLKGEYLTNFGSSSAPYFVGVSTTPSDAVVFTLSLGNANANNCLFTVTTPPASGFAYLHFDFQHNNKGFFHNASGENSQFKLYSVEVEEHIVSGGLSAEYREKLDAIRTFSHKATRPGSFVKVHGNVFVTEAQWETINEALTQETEETIDAAEALIATLPSAQDGIQPDCLYQMNNNTEVNSGFIYVNDDYFLAGTTAAIDDAIMQDADKWMIVAKAGAADTYMLYNMGKDRVANSDEVADATTGDGPDNAWTALGEFETFDRGYVVMEGMNDTQWRIRDSQVKGLTDANKNTLRCYLNNAGGEKVTVWMQNGQPNGNPNSLFNLRYVGKATAVQSAAAEAMLQKIQHPVVKHPVSAVGYATLYYSDRNLLVPEGVDAYVFQEEGTGIKAVCAYEAATNAIPKGTGVVLKLKEGATAGTFEFALRTDDEVSEAEHAATEGNLLKGTDEATDVVVSSTGNLLYMLKQPEEKAVGFYLASEDGTSFHNGAHKAYMEVSTTIAEQGTRAFDFDELFNTPTRLTAVAAPAASQTCFDLSGRRLAQKPARGVYVVNGKKLIVY